MGILSSLQNVIILLWVRLHLIRSTLIRFEEVQHEQLQCSHNSSRGWNEALAKLPWNFCRSNIVQEPGRKFEVVAAMCSKVPLISNAVMKATQSDSFNLLVNSGSAAGQVIFHTHFHIIPRKAGDELWPSENSRRRPIRYNQNTIVLLDCIREQLSSSSTGGHISCESMLSKN